MSALEELHEQYKQNMAAHHRPGVDKYADDVKELKKLEQKVLKAIGTSCSSSWLAGVESALAATSNCRLWPTLWTSCSLFQW